MHTVTRFLLLMLVATAVPAANAEAGLIGTLGDDSCIAYQSSTGVEVLFCDADVQPTGTGVLKPFLRVQKDGAQKNGDDTPSTYTSGFNTDANGGLSAWNDFDHSWTSALSIDDVTPDDDNLVEFLVDINQKASEGSDLLSLNRMVLYNCDDNDYKTLEESCTSFFDLFGNTGDFINFDYRLHTGSGSGDVKVYIPYDAGFAGPYIALLDGWGCGDGSSVIPDAYSCDTPGIVGDNDGFQEWAARQGGSPPPIPEPASLILLGSGLTAAAAARRRKKSQN